MSIKSERRPGDPPPLHAGRILLTEFLEPLDVTQAKFAAAIGINPAYVSDIVNGRRGISPEMAMRFEVALGMPAQFWLNIQNAVDLYRVRFDSTEISKRSTIQHRITASA